MAEITEDHVAAVYKLAKEVHAKAIKLEDAASELVAAGMNPTSAKYYILIFLKMILGRPYRLSMNTFGTQYFLENIRKDYGDEIFAKALHSVRQHIVEQEKWSKKGSIRKIVDQYKGEFPEVISPPYLDNLNEVGNEAKQRYLEEFKWQDTPLSDRFIEAFKKKSTEKLFNSCEMGKYTGRLVNKNGQTIDFPNQLLVISTYFVDYALLAKRYHVLVMAIFIQLAAASGGLVKDTKDGKREFFDLLRGSGDAWKKRLEEKYSSKVVTEFENIIAKSVATQEEQDHILKYISVEKWSHSGKELERNDYPSSGILAVAGVVQADQGILDDFVVFLADNPDLLEMLNEDVENIFSGASMLPPTTTDTGFKELGGINQIVYGAPGSGKSHYLEELVSQFKSIRTVFHPEYQHSDFVGGVRPSIRDGGQGVSYEYVPGPFIQALLEAFKHKDKAVYLIIEEINRANAAAVFGDIFQLLDRKPDGSSQYAINADMSLRNFLKSEGIPEPELLRIPPNLSIMATMNSSDQGVFMLDAAFKRRWQFRHCEMDYNSKKTDGFIAPRVSYAGKQYSWKDFACTLNEALKSIRVEEDRLIGPYFLTEEERATQKSCGEAVAGKLLIYLWDDVLRHNQRQELFDSSFRTYSDLLAGFRGGKKIFRTLDKQLDELAIQASNLVEVKATDSTKAA